MYYYSIHRVASVEKEKGGDGVLIVINVIPSRERKRKIKLLSRQATRDVM